MARLLDYRASMNRLRNDIRRQPLPVWFAGLALAALGLQWLMEFREKGYVVVVKEGVAGESNTGALAAILIGITFGFGILLLLYCTLGWFIDRKR